MSLETFGPESHAENNVALSAKGQALDMNLKALANANNGERKFVMTRWHSWAKIMTSTDACFGFMCTGSATVALMTLTGMDSLLSHQYFKTENKTEMNSDVFTVLLPTVNNTNLTEPVNFTIQHKKVSIHTSIHSSIHLFNLCLYYISRKYLKME